MTRLLAVALLAELADLATYRPANEVSPITLALGPYAIPVKLLLLVVLAAGFLAFRERWRPVLLAGVAAGAFGAWSNL